MFQKINAQSAFGQSSAPRPISQATEMYDTEFEEDLSDFEEYSGRRSEESVGTRGHLNLSYYLSNTYTRSLATEAIQQYLLLKRYKLQL